MSLLGPNRRTEGTTKKNPVWRPHGFGKDGLRAKMLGSPYKQHDGTLHPRIFRGHLNSPSELTMPAPLSPMFTIVPSSKQTFLDTHVMAVVTVRKEVEENPETHISAMSAVFASNSIHNMTRVTYEKEALSSFQIRAMVEAISAAYGAQAHLKAAGCQRLVITIDRDMEWIPRVLVRYHDLIDRADEDETLLHQFIRYPKQMRHLMEFIDTFEAITNIKLQFWPTEKQELSAAYLWANTAVDNAMSNYERDYYGVFDDTDYDVYEEEDEIEDDDDNLMVSDEEELEEPEEPREISIQDIDVVPEIATETLADTLGPMDSDFEEQIIDIPVTSEETTNVKASEVMLPSDMTPRIILPFDKMIDVSGIDHSSFTGHGGSFAYVLAEFSFGTAHFEELFNIPSFLETIVEATPTSQLNETPRFLASLMHK